MKDKKLRLAIIASIFLLIIYLFALLIFMRFAFYATTYILISFALLWTFYFIDSHFKVGFKIKHYFIVLALIVISDILSPLWFLTPWYGWFLHFFTPILICTLIFVPINKLKLNFGLKLLFVVTIFMSYMVLHEIGEYSLDQAFDAQLQGVYIKDFYSGTFTMIRTPHTDTMMNLILDCSGSIIFVILGYNYFRWKNRKKTFKHDFNHK